MKRSEALKLMYKTSVNLYNELGSLASPEMHMDYILKALEDAGMLPPIEPDRRIEDLDLGVPQWEDEESNS